MKNEGKTTTMIEEETKKIPSITFLTAAVGSMVISASLLLMGKKQIANFIGQWAPTILIMGVYNKIAKTFSAPYSEQQRMEHGGHAVPKPNDNIGSQVPSYS